MTNGRTKGSSIRAWAFFSEGPLPYRVVNPFRKLFLKPLHNGHHVRFGMISAAHRSISEARYRRDSGDTWCHLHLLLGRGLHRVNVTPDGLDAFHQQALEILRSNKTRNAFILDAEPVSIRHRYGITPFGQGALAARRLIEAGVRFITVSLGGWDTHGQNFTPEAINSLASVKESPINNWMPGTP